VRRKSPPDFGSGGLFCIQKVMTVSFWIGPSMNVLERIPGFGLQVEIANQPVEVGRLDTQKTRGAWVMFPLVFSSARKTIWRRASFTAA